MKSGLYYFWKQLTKKKLYTGTWLQFYHKDQPFISKKRKKKN